MTAARRVFMGEHSLPHGHHSSVASGARGADFAGRTPSAHQASRPDGVSAAARDASPRSRD